MQPYSAALGDNDFMQEAHWAMIDRQMLDEADKAEAQAVLQRVVELTRTHRQKAAAIRGDGHLSESGRRAALVSLIEKSDADLVKATAPLLDKLQTKIRTAERAIENAVTAEPTAQETMRMIEIRGLLYADDDKLMTEAALIQFAGDGRDDLAVQSILTASEMKPLVSPAAATRARGIMAARLLPDASGELVDSRETTSVLRSVIQNAQDSFSTVIERAALGMPDAITRAASGVGNFQVPRADAPGA